MTTMARAPGKVVLSGAYAVLEGAPALVAAVDRYVIADPRREAEFVTPEVREALANRGTTRAPWFDARALRDEANERKLGLGSSAAILVASLAALELGPEPTLPTIDDATLARRVFDAALCAHRIAQGGGSGVDVAASAFGGILHFQLPKEGSALPTITHVKLPDALTIGVWSSTSAAATSVMLAGVAALRQARPAEHRVVLDRLASAAEATSQATTAAAYVAACRRQLEGLADLGKLADVPIVTSEVAELDRAATTAGAAVLPSGAGGGDIVLVVSDGPPRGDLLEAAERLGLVPLNLGLGARGVHAATARAATDGRN
jgi:phosphomevalonate kinase